VALALYRKYRPATFAEVVGQEHVTTPLVNAVDGGRINHAYLFSGPRGCGKTSSARILARSLNCEQGPTSTPCGTCGSCVALAPDGPGSLDVIEIDAASHGGVDDARDLRERAFFAPVNSRFKVYIVDEAHMVTTQGFNALLKVVEEPPEFLVFVFATTEPDKVLPTIRSRTHHYPFRLVPPTTLRGLLEKTCAAEGVQVEPTVFRWSSAPVAARSVTRCRSSTSCWPAPARRASPTRAPSGCWASPTTRCSTRRSTPSPRTTRPASSAPSTGWWRPGTTRAGSPPTCSTGCGTSSCSTRSRTRGATGCSTARPTGWT
jgi:DNA polymerase III, tau subunit (EC 2.7.7.7)